MKTLISLVVLVAGGFAAADFQFASVESAQGQVVESSYGSCDVGLFGQIVTAQGQAPVNAPVMVEIRKGYFSGHKTYCLAK